MEEKKVQSPEIVLKEMSISHFKEEHFEWHDIFSFQLNGMRYKMYLYEGLKKENHYEIGGLIHEEEFCPFCTKEKIQNQHCDVLLQHKKNLFYHVIRHSKDRLRWLQKEIK